MKAAMDHFLVIKSQQDIDLEIARVEMEGKAIMKLQKKEKRIILIDQARKEQDKMGKFLISNFTSNEVLVVAALGSDCAEMEPEVKIGSSVIVRANTRPEESLFNGLVYLSYPIRSVSLILEEKDINPPTKIKGK